MLLNFDSTSADIQSNKNLLRGIIELNVMYFKNRGFSLFIYFSLYHSAYYRNDELHLGGKKNNYALYGGLSFWHKRGGKGSGNG